MDAGDGAPTDARPAPDGGDGAVDDGGAASDPADLVEHGEPSTSQKGRPDYGMLVVASDGERSYAVESRRDVEQGPFNLPWRSRFRVAAYDGSEEVWQYSADPDDAIGDVVVHASGDVTVALLRHPPQEHAYDLVRLTRDGEVIGAATLQEPATAPDADYVSTDPRPLFKMKSAFADATTAGWVRLLPDGEGLTVAILSFAYPPPNQTDTRQMVLGLVRLDWQDGDYVERWARIVEGPHAADPAAWAYDELRWREQAVRPWLARDDESGAIAVGRAWNQSRCTAHRTRFGGFTDEECLFDAVNVAENERLPLAVTRFDANGERLGTVILAPDEDAAEQLPFGLAARAGRLAVVGSVVRKLEDGGKRTYSDPDGYVDYDGYITVYDADGRPLEHHDFNLGRGDVLAALRWTDAGILAVGSAGWDRGQRGMSISRGCDPLFVWLSSDRTRSATRVVRLSDGERHYSLHDAVVLEDAIIGYGFSDAPMTHSADDDKHAERTFGPLQVRLAP